LEPVQLIRHDHQHLERLFRHMEQVISSENTRGIAAALRDITRELSIHAAIEEQFLYPALRAGRPESDVLYAVEEHHAVKAVLSELQAMPPADSRFASKVRLLIHNAREHIEEEESELLPAIEKTLSPDQLRELGGALANAKLLSPTRPHLRAPELPPGNLVLGPAVGMIDRMRDGVRDTFLALRDGAESAVQAAVILLRRISTEAERRGRQAVDNLAARTRVVATEARDVGRRTVEDAAGAGAEAARQLRAPAGLAVRKSRRVARKASRRSRPAA
jgi:hemerythrin superfamily protein